MIGTVHSCVCARPPGGRATCTLLAHTAFQSVRTRACRCRASRDIAGIRASRRMGSPSAGRSCTSTGSPLRGTPGRMVISRQISHLEPFVPLLSHAGLTIKGTILVLELGLHGFECIDSLTQLLVFSLQPVKHCFRPDSTVSPFQISCPSRYM